MSIPFEPRIADLPVNVHLILECLAFFIAYRYYVLLRRREQDSISSSNRLSIILGAAIGALTGSRIMGFLENSVFDFADASFLQLYNLKTIMGGLFGGLIGVELTKKIIHEERSSGDLFTLPIILGILIGRIGCFLSGTKEFTYGKPTTFALGMNLGDGIQRHPIALYEMIFLLVLFVILHRRYQHPSHEAGFIFKIFMISYFGFRFLIEFIKPNTFFIAGLSSIQWLCILCFVYYRNTLFNLVRAH